MTRLAYTTDPAIGVAGYYMVDDEGRIDTSARYDFVPADDDPENPAGSFELSEHQYVRVQPDGAPPPAQAPPRVVPLEAVAHGVGKTEAKPEKRRRITYRIGKHK